MPGAEGATLQEPLRVSILRRNGHLVASIHTALDDGQLSRFREDLLERTGRGRAGGVITYVAALGVINSFAAHMMRMIGQVAQLRGATTAVVGIHPGGRAGDGTARYQPPPVPTALDLEGGLACLDSASIAGGGRRRLASAPERRRGIRAISLPQGRGRPVRGLRTRAARPGDGVGLLEVVQIHHQVLMQVAPGTIVRRNSPKPPRRSSWRSSPP